jgi:hypothetical protein
MSGPALLQRITTEYVDVEDRMRLSAEVKGGPPVVLWLSQRLLLRLLPGTIHWLDRQAGGDATLSHVMQGFAQHAAQAELTPQAPVRATATGSSAWLVQTVDVVVSAQLMSLTFRGGSGQAATLNLEAKPMRQWLSIVRGLCQKAGWPMQAWPDWFDTQTEMTGGKSLTLH